MVGWLGCAGLLVVSVVLRLEKIPSSCCHHEAAGDPYHGQGDAEELQHVGADQGRTKEQKKAVDGHLESQRVALGLGAMAREAEKNRRVADGINDREQSGIDQQESVDDVARGLGLH